MKASQIFLRTAVLTIILSWLLLPQDLAAQVSLQVSPAAAGPRYNGLLTVQISGLTNGETVALTKFLDVNGNGTLDSMDQCVQRIKVTDGQVSVIAGVTNVNAPGDIDSASGSAKIQFDYFKAGFEQRLPGQYIFEVASPSGRFAPVRTLFTITNSGDGQSISGSVLNGSNPVPYAWVVVFQGQAFRSYPIASALANGSGQYSIALPPGTYAVAGVQSNYVTDIPSVPTVTLTAGKNALADLAVIPATETISGDLTDATHPGSSFPAIGLTLVSSDYRFAFGLTDTNGHFNIPVTPATWTIDIDNQDNLPMFRSVYTGKTQVNASSGSVSGLTLPLTRGTALIHGSVKDTQNKPLPGLKVYGSDQNGNEGDGESDLNGYYVAAVTGGQWYVNAGSDGAYANYAFSQVGSVSINDGEAIRQDIVGVLATNTISGYLKDSSGNAMGGIDIWGNATINGTQFNVDAQTDESGYYSLVVANGSWTVGVNNQGNHTLPSNYIAPFSQTAGITNNDATVNFTAVYAPNKITGTVKNSSGQPITNVRVYAQSQINGLQVDSGMATDNSGSFSISVANGTWTVGVSCNGSNQTLYQQGYDCVQSQTVTIANNNGTAYFVAHSLSALQVDTAWLPDATVGSFYSFQLSASGGAQPYSWSVAPASPSLPSGLNVSSNGILSGIPATPSTNLFVVRVTDGLGHYADQGLSLGVSAPFQPTISSPARLSNGHFQMQVMGFPGQSYTVLTTTNIASTWSLLFMTNAPTNGFIIIDPDLATNAQRYYRLQVNPLQ